MTDHEPDLTRALRQLRGEIRAAVTAPSAAALRARATRALRVRRTVTVVAAAAAVAAVALGGTTLLQPVAGPVPPAQSPTPGVEPTPEVEPTPSPSGPPAVTLSPRPAPRSPEPLDDPIGEVDWRRATITVPARSGCPDGTITFAPRGDGDEAGGLVTGPAAGYPKVSLDTGQIGYGDLTGDGRAEAVLEASCDQSDEGGGHGHQLLVVARSDDGTLTGLDWVGPRGAYYADFWVADGRLLISADPWTVEPAESFVAVPGLALTYTWTPGGTDGGGTDSGGTDGGRFTGWEPAPEYPPIIPLDHADAGPPVAPGPVATGLGCPDTELRFTRAEQEWGGTARADGAVFTIAGRAFQQYLFDLDGTGDRLLVTALECTRAGRTVSGLAVFEATGPGWRGISVLVPPAGQVLEGWEPDGARLAITWSDPAEGDEPSTEVHRWTGTRLIPSD